MADDWENIVIETGVDTLLNYLAENGDTPVSEISEDLGVSEDRIKEWAKALEDNNFVERTYSARKGMILHYTKKNKENADEKLQEIREEIEEETQKVEEEMDSRNKEIKQKKEELQEMSEQLEEHRQKEQEVKQNVEELEELEEELEQKLEEQKRKEKELHEGSVQLISRIDNTLNRIEEAEETAERFETEEQELRKKMKALRKLEKHTDKVEDLDRELEELEEKEADVESIFSSFKRKISSLFSRSTDYDSLLSKPVGEIKQKVREKDDIEIKELLEKERKGKNRKTLISFLEKRLNDE